MKSLSLLLFAILTVYTALIFASKANPVRSIKTKDGIIHRSPYFYETFSNSTQTNNKISKLPTNITDNPAWETQQLCNRIQSVIDMPYHMRTEQIEETRILASDLQQIINQKLSYIEVLCNPDVQNTLQKYLLAKKEIKNPQEHEAYLKAWYEGIYTWTDLAELECQQQRALKLGCITN
ncbi:MAG: hypothetical protein Q8Q60_03460 [Candidatus Chromulinivorax sp.]|nr:hypothetical protein [Candidatus Chromulinivorax sp.]